MSIMAFDIIWNITAEHNPIHLKKKKKNLCKHMTCLCLSLRPNEE